jgi:hypothetical protein
MAAQRTGNPAIRNGLLFGALLGALGLANAVIQWLTGAYHAVANTTNGFTSVTVADTGAPALLSCILFLALLALTFTAGILAARSTGKVGSGALAGLCAGLVGGLVSGVGNLVIILTFVAPGIQAPAGSSMTQAQVQVLLLGTTIGGAIVGLLLDAGLGAGMGALGGLLGANSARRARSAVPYAPASYYSAYPGYPGYPAMPPQPGQPGQPGATPQSWPSPPTPIPTPTPTRLSRLLLRVPHRLRNRSPPWQREIAPNLVLGAKGEVP